MNTTRAATNAASTFQAPRRGAQAASLALAALMTLGVLASLHGLAGSENAARQEMAQSAASAPRS